jgi:HEAT repeat protein
MSAKIQRLKEDHNLEGLEQALRHPTDFILRQDAAQALGELNDLEAVEWLIRSYLEDPNAEVKKTAHTALDELVGAEAGLAISSYQNESTEADPWLKDFKGTSSFSPRPAEVLGIYLSDNDKIHHLRNEGDLDGLVHWLRNPIDPLSREEAAIALGELGDLKGVDPLIRAHLEDPIEEVREIAYEALENLVGSQTDLAISAYRSSRMETDAWLLDHSQDDDAPDDDEEWEEVASDELLDYLAEDVGEPIEDQPVDLEQLNWDRQNLDGLIAVLRNEKDPTLRLRAMQALQHSSNIHAISFLAQTALYNEDEELRIAAKTALKNRFGDDADGIVESYRDATLEAEDEGDDEEAEEDDATGAESAYQQLLPAAALPQKPVIREEKMDWRVILASFLVIAAFVVIIILLTTQ